MCLIIFAWNVHPEYPLVLTANRDEFYARPTAPATFWENEPNILAGKDLQAGGTWMGVTKSGRFAAVTNYRDPANIRESAKSRGNIPTSFLASRQHPEDYLKELKEEATEYNGFNALLLQGEDLYHFSNYEGKINRLKPGIYGLSNALLDTPWPKVVATKAAFQSQLSKNFELDDLIRLMQNEETYSEELLPKTGIPLEWEKAVSASCIRTEKYGTCCTTAITLSKSGVINFMEKSYPVGNRKEQTTHLHFQIES